jgi:tetratricopeptide (TPR) repeat protein
MMLEQWEDGVMKNFDLVQGLRQAALVLATSASIAASTAVHGQGGGVGGVPGYPDNIDAYDPREVAMLPGYCKYTQLFRGRVPGGDNQTEIDRWYAIAGETFHAMHHYCWGLMKTNRAMLLTREPKYRKFYLEDSIGEFEYVLRYTPDNHPLLPEILTKKGENLIRLDRASQGIKDLARAIEAKPDYWPAYLVMSDYYKGTGDIKRAREVLENALTFAPEAKPVMRRLAELDTTSPRPAKR